MMYFGEGCYGMVLWQCKLIWEFYLDNKSSCKLELKLEIWIVFWFKIERKLIFEDIREEGLCIVDLVLKL